LEPAWRVLAALRVTRPRFSLKVIEVTSMGEAWPSGKRKTRFRVRSEELRISSEVSWRTSRLREV